MANQLELAEICQQLATAYQALEPGLAYDYRRQQLIYEAGHLPQKLAKAKALVSHSSLAALQGRSRHQELVFLKTQICMFDFKVNYHDFATCLKYLHGLASELRQCRYYDQRQYRIVKSWLSLATHLSRLPHLSISNLQAWLRQHASQPARLNGEGKPEVRQAYNLLQSVRRFVYIVQHRQTGQSSGSDELDALAHLYHQHWLNRETVLQCLVNFMQANRLQIILDDH